MHTQQNLEVILGRISALETQASEAEMRATRLEVDLATEREARLALQQSMEEEHSLTAKRTLALEKKLRATWECVLDKLKKAEGVARDMDEFRKAVDARMQALNKKTNNISRLMNGRSHKLYARVQKIEEAMSLVHSHTSALCGLLGEKWGERGDPEWNGRVPVMADVDV